MGADAVQKSEARAPGRGVPYPIHVIDDDAQIRESLKALLDDAGFIAYCYEDAAQFLAESAGVRGCALIDLKMHAMDGLALQQRLIAVKSNVDVVMMSAYGELGDAVSAMRRGAVDFIEKPFDPEDLIARLESLRSVRARDNHERRTARHNAALIELLTPREKQVLNLLVDGMANKQIARALGISVRTVETHRVHLMGKLEAESLAHLVRIWMAAGRDLKMRDA